ncbi:MAG: hypothetical protein ACRDL5_05845 [Solirubrobacteraceae bacterium]
MADWVTISSLATAGGTLVLAIATFSSVRSANRSARIAERSLLVGLRPVLVPSREEDPTERLRFGDSHVLRVPGHGAAVEEEQGIVYLAIGLRNGGAGLAVLHGWRARIRQDPHGDEMRERAVAVGPRPAPDLDEFRRQQVDLFVPAGDTGYWLGAMRDPGEAGRDEVLAALRAGGLVQVDLLYGDHEGGQRTIVRFLLSPWADAEAWRAVAINYWNVDGDDPRS